MDKGLKGPKGPSPQMRGKGVLGWGQGGREA